MPVCNQIMRNLVLFLLFPTFAHAGPYIELGIGSADGCIKTGKECSERPLGIAAVGFEHKGFSASVEHISDLRDGQDYGLNLFSIRYRYEFRK